MAPPAPPRDDRPVVRQRSILLDRVTVSETAMVAVAGSTIYYI